MGRRNLLAEQLRAELAEIKARLANVQAVAKHGRSNGGKARAAKLTPEQRSEIAKRASAARWSKRRLETLSVENAKAEEPRIVVD